MRPREGAEEIRKISATCAALVNEVSKAIIGKRIVLNAVMVDILSNGNLLFEDFPGLAKTLMANSFAVALGCKFKRIQFTPDLLPSDITGTYIFDEKSNEFKFRPGPIFTNILLADEINRAPPKTQAALLEAMQEHQVTIEGITHKLPKPFLVLATQNPVEQEGTYPLPEAQLDRFLMKMSVGYPNREEEREILMRRDRRGKDEVDLDVITNAEKIVEMQLGIEKVYVDPAIMAYIVEIVQRTREDPRVYVGSSPRGAQALFKLSRSLAALNGRDYVTPDDVKSVAPAGLKHRLILKPEPKIRGVTGDDILTKILKEVPVPAV
ncbi:MAG: MoxR family ATPase [Thermoplasmata archaeon]